MEFLKRNWLKTLLATGGFLIVAFLVFVLAVWWQFRNWGEFSWGNKGDAGPKIVHLLDAADPEAGPYGVIFGEIVTGDQALLVRDQAWLEAQKDALWFEDRDSLGSFVGGFVFGMMGMPLSRQIGEVVQGGVVVASYSCLSVNCQDGLISGMDGLKGAVPGVPVAQDTLFFTSYEAYLAAHAAVVADPERWFASLDDQDTLPDDDGMRRVTVTWPAGLLPSAPDFRPAYDDPQARARLEDWAEALIAQTGGRIDDIAITEGMPLWLLKDGVFVHDESDGATVALSDLSLRTAIIRLNVPVRQLDEIIRRYQDNPPPGADLHLLEPAVARGFVARGFETSCLPECGGAIQQGLENEAELSVGSGPSWSFRVWELTPAQE